MGNNRSKKLSQQAANDNGRRVVVDLDRYEDILFVMTRSQDFFAAGQTALSNLLSETKADMICGSWLSKEGNRTLAIRKKGAGYSALLCDATKLYKVIEREFHVKRSKTALSLWENGERIKRERVKYYMKTGLLLFGPYGLFEPEEVMLKADDTATDCWPEDEIPLEVEPAPEKIESEAIIDDDSEWWYFPSAL